MADFPQGIFLTQLFIHPQEKEAQGLLQNNSIITGLAKDTANLKMKLSDAAEMRLNDYLVTESTAPRIHRQYKRVLETLHDGFSVDQKIIQEYPLFITQEHDIKADVFGSEANGYMISISSGAVEDLTDAELRALLGQAVGHIRAGHVPIMELLRVFQGGFDQIPVFGKLAGDKLWSMFSHWMYYSEYTADRAGALCAGSIEAALSLLCKQIGATLPGQTPYSVMQQPVHGMPEAGIYLVWIARSMPVFNAVGRMRELEEWSKTKEFRRECPYMYYCAQAARGEHFSDQQQEALMNLHSKAAADDLDAIAKLGSCYLQGLNGLPANKTLGLSMTRFAALHGCGEAMYLLYLCSEVKMEGAVFSSDVSKQLLRAAASRTNQAANAARGLKKKSRVSGLDALIRNFYSDECRCVVCPTAPGDPIDDTDLSDLRDDFLMEAGEPVLAYETFRCEGEYYGTALTPFGLYGRMPGQTMPFAVSWEALKDSEVFAKKFKHKNYLYCGKRRIYRIADELENTLGELIVRIKSALCPA